MTKVTFFLNHEHTCIGFCTEDHAGYAEAGTDIVCSAISALTITCINALDQLTEDQTDLSVSEEDARIRLMLKGAPSEQALLLLAAYRLGIQGIAEEETYREFIELEFMEV